MIDIILYTNNSDNAVIDKDITELETLSGRFNEPCSIINPEFMLTGLNADLIPKINYCYIASFGRYYYVQNIQINRNSEWVLFLHVDVLKTYAEKIKTCEALLESQETEANLYISGAHVPLLAQKKTEIQAFTGIEFSPNGSADSSMTLVLATVGEATGA